MMTKINALNTRQRFSQIEHNTTRARVCDNVVLNFNVIIQALPPAPIHLLT